MKLGTPVYSNCWPLPVLRNHGLAKTINLYPDYFTFTFVRNPYARFLSYCFFGLGIAEERGLPASSLGYSNLQECVEFTAELLADGADTFRFANRFASLKKKMELGKGKPDLMKYTRYHCKPQVDFLLDLHPSRFMGIKRVNDAPCSFIGRQESFSQDFLRVLEILNVPKTSEEFKRAYERKQTQHYSHYYDKATRRRVEELYARDLEVLGYEFEQEGVVSVLNPLSDLREAQEKHKGEIRLSTYQWAEIHCKRILMYLKGVVYSYITGRLIINILRRLQQ